MSQIVNASDKPPSGAGKRDNVGIDARYEGPLNDKAASLPPPRGELLAWDPVKQRAAWRAPQPVVDTGGVLTTAGNLVFQGRSDGMVTAYRATDGRQVVGSWVPARVSALCPEQ